VCVCVILVVVLVVVLVEYSGFSRIRSRVRFV